MDDDTDSNVLPFPSGGIGAAQPGGGPAAEGGMGGGVVQLQTKDGTAVSVFEDGSVAIALPAPYIRRNYDDDQFDENLAERIPEQALAGIVDECVEGVESDMQTRSDLVDQYERGIELLGTRIEDIASPSSAGRSISRIGHPLLLETMIKYHAGAAAEMLPAEGPAKVQTIGTPVPGEDELAEDFASDFNYYLTEVASEFYPDTEHMLMELAYCGNAYKKVFRCAMRDRPVSESVSMLDLIVSEEAKTLEAAIRVTHQIQMARGQLRRMQIAGRYMDIDLGYPQSAQIPGRNAVKEAEGLSPGAMRPQDVPYNIWEIDVDIDLERHPIFGKWEQRAPDGLPLPYKITCDPQTRRGLAITRNWKPEDKFYNKNNMYVHYGLVPSLGFHHWGFLHLLGNHTRALRAIWRIMVDSGMFSSFPGGIKLRGARTASNEIAPGPGEWVDVDAPAGTDIRQLLMAMPYKSIDGAFIQLAQIIEEGAHRLGGNVMIETGEGRTNVPVGTMMSMLEQQTQIMAAVHRRTHRAQRQELRKIRELFAERPSDLMRLSRDPKRDWEVYQEFTNLNLVPASDPDIPSQVHRVQLAVALATIMQMNPTMFDQHEVMSRLLRTVRIAAPETLLVQPGQMPMGAQPQPNQDPTKMLALQQKGEIAKQQGIQRMAEQQQKAQQSDRDHAAKLAEQESKAQQDQADRQQEAQTAALESADRAADRHAHTEVAAMREETARLKANADLAQAHAVGNFAPDSL